ncbi:ferredoxin [Nocardia panacis]|uniref:Ferredoxin n=1 Tax=Nocardia panacis TaxID=2340916 RepID=A0A3A4KVD1_9NOCA|nr:ferredoxin [Nocardia panacis]RJO79200.1 ferredoxin [Nocardia panacis]
MTDQRWRVEVDRNTCIGSGVCIGTAPDHFTLVDGHSSPNAELVDPDDSVTDAADFCPVEAIRVRLAHTGEVLAPKL